jgi:hypothetical protein
MTTMNLWPSGSPVSIVPAVPLTIEGALTTESAEVTANATIGGTLGVTGNTTLSGNLTLTGVPVETPSTAQVIAAGTAILANAGVVQITTAADVTTTATPLIANGTNGQIVQVVNTGTHNLALKDQATLAGSNIRFTGTTLTLATLQAAEFVYLSGVGDWVLLNTTGTIA